MRQLLHRKMNFAYIEKGVPRVLTARVMIQFPADLMTRAKHVLSSIAFQRTNLFVINDEEYDYHAGSFETDFVSWKMTDRAITAIPRAAKDPDNRSCICCALAEYFDRLMQAWLKSNPAAVELITLDVVLSDNEDAQFIEDNRADLNTMFFEASVFVLEAGTKSWASYGVFFTDNSKYDGTTFFVQEKGTKNVTATNANVRLVEFENDDVHQALARFTDNMGIYDGVMTSKV